MDLLGRFCTQHLQLAGVHGIDIVLLQWDIDDHLVFVVPLGFDNTKVFADFVGAFCSPRLGLVESLGISQTYHIVDIAESVNAALSAFARGDDSLHDIDV